MVAVGLHEAIEYLGAPLDGDAEAVIAHRELGRARPRHP
jgi:hypothetical protein